MTTLRRAAWFARRPWLYREMGRRVVAKVAGHSEPDERAEAVAWCSERAESWRIARDRLGIPESGPISRVHPDVVAFATARAAAAPPMGGGASTDVLYDLATWRRPEVAVETGVAYGWSSLALLLAGVRLISTDMPYPLGKSEDHVGCIVPDDLRGSWTLIRRPDRDALPGVLRGEGEVGLFHYDSDKSRSGRMWAYRLAWTHLAPGAPLVSDDVDDNLAFRDFTAEVGVTPIVVTREETHVGLLFKPWNPPTDRASAV